MEKGAYESLYRLTMWDKAGLGGNKVFLVPEHAEIDIIEIRYLTASVWGRTESGWICMYMNGTGYVKKK